MKIDDEAKKDEYHATRKRRAGLWLARARRATKEGDENAVQVILYWIAFEAMYNQHDKEDGTKVRKTFIKEVLSQVDGDGSVARVALKKVIRKKRGAIKKIVNLLQVRKKFFSNVLNSVDTEQWEDWKEDEMAGIKTILGALRIGKLRNLDNLTVVLIDLFDRLQVVRNQIIHGGNSMSEGYGRTQVDNAQILLAELIPIFFDELERRPQLAIGIPPFPRIGAPDQQNVHPVDIHREE